MKGRLYWATVLSLVISGCTPNVDSNPAALTGCTITKDDGTTYTDESVDACTDYYPSTHVCSISSNRPGSCAVQDMFRAVDWSAKQDLINNVKKGLWSMDLSNQTDSSKPVAQDLNTCVFTIEAANPRPINSLAAMKAARLAGFQSVELDTTLLFDAGMGPPTYDNSLPMIGHAYDYWYFTDYSGEATQDTSQSVQTAGMVYNTFPDEFAELVRDNDGPWTMLTITGEAPVITSPYTEEDFQWIPAIDFISIDTDPYYIDGMLERLWDWSIEENMPVLVVVDPKFSRQPQTNIVLQRSRNILGFTVKAKFKGPDIEYVSGQSLDRDNLMLIQIQQIVDYLVDLESLDGYAGITSMVAIKTSLPLATIKESVDDWDKFSWIPLADNSTRISNAATYLTSLDAWFNEDADNVLYVDNNNSGADWWQSQPFDWDGTTFVANSNGEYRDVNHYFKQKYNRRGQFWSPTAQLPDDTVGKYASQPQLQLTNAALPLSYKSIGVAMPEHSFTAPDPASHLLESTSAWAVVTTDRPDIFLQIRNKAAYDGTVGCSE